MTYEIRSNAQFNSSEVYFDGKPSEAIREALKALKFRWHSVKKCWYGYAQEHEIVSAILDTSTEEEPATVYTDGYLGGGAVYGSKSNLHLYGTDLAKAIREDLKKAGIKGVTIASKHGNIQATMVLTASDCIPFEQFLESYNVRDAFGWVDYHDENGMSKTVHIQDYYDLPDELRERIRREHAEMEYREECQTNSGINHYHLDKYHGYTEDFMHKVHRVVSIISAYRYDETNTMVDYFDTNFYFDIYTKVA